MHAFVKATGNCGHTSICESNCIMVPTVQFMYFHFQEPVFAKMILVSEYFLYYQYRVCQTYIIANRLFGNTIIRNYFTV